jgi:predicted nucleic acid-binding Zn ribbon protein
MPIDEYWCPDCGATYEEFQGVNDNPLKSAQSVMERIYYEDCNNINRPYAG